MTVKRSLIVAASENDVIGRDGDLPWHLPGDLRYFRDVTRGHAVVLGRLTHESIVARLGRPLPGRTSVVVSTTAHADSENVRWKSSVESALAEAEALERASGQDEVFVIGGATVYQQALHAVDRVYLTRVRTRVEGDSRMPAGWLEGFAQTSRVDVEAGANTGGGTGAGASGDSSALAHSFLRYERVPA
ncbi:dihydrofolate reductase [Streptomyces sp. AK08-02]|uniref:dihydrofolate reductase n=1 Tax=Streptomyces sp. AK08-02 TaxID=3028654 RepID=UPI0029A6941E|nr:dihydrofolate reductase [Streptomyces sp. AK08-02]MDX3752732.1 dihydrofolate reductase [Streptomyces sp. AK08-02]